MPAGTPNYLEVACMAYASIVRNIMRHDMLHKNMLCVACTTCNAKVQCAARSLTISQFLVGTEVQTAHVYLRHQAYAVVWVCPAGLQTESSVCDTQATVQ